MDGNVIHLCELQQYKKEVLLDLFCNLQTYFTQRVMRLSGGKQEFTVLQKQSCFQESFPSDTTRLQKVSHFTRWLRALTVSDYFREDPKQITQMKPTLTYLQYGKRGLNAVSYCTPFPAFYAFAQTHFVIPRDKILSPS